MLSCSESESFSILSPTKFKRKKKPKTVAQKSVMVPEEEDVHISRLAVVYQAAAILVKLNSYCPSFMHLTNNPECSGLFRLCHIVNRKLPVKLLRITCWFRLSSEINVP